MSTTVSHKGSHRSVTGLPIESWNKHKNVIIAYCDGADVEVSGVPGKWTVCKPDFKTFFEYRVAQRKPQPGEVWFDEPGDTKDGCYWLITRGDKAGEIGYVSLANHYHKVERPNSLVPAAPSVEAYYAREFRAETQRRLSKSGDTIDPLKDTLFGVLRESAKEDTMK